MFSLFESKLFSCNFSTLYTGGILQYNLTQSIFALILRDNNCYYITALGIISIIVNSANPDNSQQSLIWVFTVCQAKFFQLTVYKRLDLKC